MELKGQSLYFSVTGELCEIDETGGRLKPDGCMYGCIHDIIAEYMPEYRRYLKWHLCGVDGPMHYLANTIYFAGDRDYRGLRKGDVQAWDTWLMYEDCPIPLPIKSNNLLKYIEGKGLPKDNWIDEEIVAVEHPRGEYTPKYKLSGMGPLCWAICPIGNKHTADALLEVLQSGKAHIKKVPAIISKGKERELDKARNAAVWPDATDEELCLPPDQLKQKLLDRLPALLEEFRKDMKELGLKFPEER